MERKFENIAAVGKQKKDIYFRCPFLLFIYPYTLNRNNFRIRQR